MRKLFRFLYSVLVVTCGCTLGAVGYLQNALPNDFTVTRGQSFHIGRLVEEAADESVTAASALNGRYRTELRLASVIPLKEVAVSVVDRPVVMVCGTPFGIKMYTDGVLVVGMSDVTTAAGNVNPAAAAGVCIGDTILSVDGQEVSTGKQVGRLINACGGRSVTLHVRRDGVEFDAAFTPVRPVDEDGYRAGMWVRDSTAGVGTLTFYDPDTGVFGGLGHPVCDTDTGARLEISGGEIVPARIYGVKAGQAGTPGELHGGFLPGTLGELTVNAADGVFGTLSVYPVTGQTMPVAMKQEVHTGAAQILTTVDGTRAEWYDIEVEQVRYTASSTRNMIIRITDEDLLAATGGIVQGMSGSPIVQDGKLIGAVTHVLVDNPTKGYAIFAETMLETAGSVAEENTLKEVS